LGFDRSTGRRLTKALEKPGGIVQDAATICREVLESLPELFGILASIDAYVSAADGLQMLACFESAGYVVGFVSVKTHTPAAAEVYVMGVKRGWHRRGIGCALIEAAAQLARCRGVRFLTVKTLSPSNPDPNYAATRLFYEATGFAPIEEFSDAVERRERMPIDASTFGEQHMSQRVRRDANGR
jgi:GNAT superfamily N-acetyltransferase